MSTAVLCHSLRQASRTTVILSLGAAAFFYLVLLSSATFVADLGEQMRQAPGFFRDPPRAFRALLGGSIDFVTPRGWLSTALVHPIVLALQTAGALVVASGAVAGELERGTLELVMARPVTRLRYLSAKAVAALLTVTSVNVGGIVGVLIARTTLSDLSGLSLAGVARVFLGEWAVFTLFSMLAILWSSASSLRSRATAAAVGSVVGLFFLNFASLLFDGARRAGYLSPFHYFRPSEVLAGASQAGDVIVLLSVATACAVLAGWRFATRDLTG
jgi:ABC-2 type transport system permease protein